MNYLIQCLNHEKVRRLNYEEKWCVNYEEMWDKQSISNNRGRYYNIDLAKNVENISKH